MPARELGVPHGRLTGQRPDPDGVSVFRTHELRSGWVPSLLRGRRCSSRPTSLTGRHPRPLNRWSLNPATTIHPCEAPLDEASTKGSRVFTRPIFPSPVAPGWIRSHFGFPPSSAPRDYSQRTSGRGQVIEHGPEPTLYVIDLASISALISQYVRPHVARGEAAPTCEPRLVPAFVPKNEHRRQLPWSMREPD